MCAIDVALAGELGAAGDLYVTIVSSDKVVQYDGQTGALVGDFVTQGSGGLDVPDELAFGPNGNLFVCSQVNSSHPETHYVIEYDGTTGAVVGPFIPGPGDGSSAGGEPLKGYILMPRVLMFRPDGTLLLADRRNAILSIDAATGDYLGRFAVGGPIGSLADPNRMILGPNGNLLVSDRDGRRIIEFNATTGRLVRTVANDLWPYPPMGDAGSMVLDPDGNILVGAGNDIAGVLKVDYQTGQVATFVTDGITGGGITKPKTLAIYPPNGNLLLGSKFSDGVRRIVEYDITTGAFVRIFTDLPASLGAMVFKPAPPQPMPAPAVSDVSVTVIDTCQDASTLTVSGTNLDPAQTLIKLSRVGEPDLIGVVTGGTAGSLSVSFNLVPDMAGGLRDVVVVNPVGQAATLAAAIGLSPCPAAMDGNLFVLGSGHGVDGLFEYDGQTGDLIRLMVEGAIINVGTEADPIWESELILASGFGFTPDRRQVMIATRRPFPGYVPYYDGTTGQKLGTWIAAGSGGMLQPYKLAFGPNGNLYVLHRPPTPGCAGGILEFDGLTGAFVREVVPLGGCGLACVTGFAFGPDGNIYVTELDLGVVVVDAETGACLSEPLIPASGDAMCDQLRTLVFSPESGNLLLTHRVASGCLASGQVTEHDPLTGDLLGTPIPRRESTTPCLELGAIVQTQAAALGPSGNLFVESTSPAGGPTDILEFDVDTGAFLGQFVSAGHSETTCEYLSDGVFIQDFQFRSTAVGLVGDIDGNGAVNLADFASFAVCFGRPITNPPAGCTATAALASDMDGDGLVNLTDFAIFALNFGG